MAGPGETPGNVSGDSVQSHTAHWCFSWLLRVSLPGQDVKAFQGLGGLNSSH